jgi:hypothetical protein
MFSENYLNLTSIKMTLNSILVYTTLIQPISPNISRPRSLDFFQCPRG